jgi:hypothetical protein
MKGQTMKKIFDSIINWKLKVGSHEFPGPDGGTCINEAAIVAAGFPYKSVKNWKDCPPCFSPLVAQFAIELNDRMNDVDRQRLLPFITRMAGTKGSPEIEEARALWLVRQLVNNELADICKECREFDLEKTCRAAKTESELRIAVRSLSSSSLLSSSLLLSSLLSSLLLSSLLSSLLLSLLLLSLLSSSSSLSTRGIELLDGLIRFHENPEAIPEALACERLSDAMAESVP